MLLQVICEHGSRLDRDTLAAMPYADATIKEALRLGAVINIVPKRALKTFEIGGYTIPKAKLAFLCGTILLLSLCLSSSLCKAERHHAVDQLAGGRLASVSVAVMPWQSVSPIKC